MPEAWINITFPLGILMVLNLGALMNILLKRRQKMPSFIVEKSLNSVKTFWLEQEKLIKEIHRIASRVGQRNKNVSKIILFGSLAERRGVPGSDADILIILRKDDKPFMDRIPEWSEKINLAFPIEVFPYTEKEINNPIVQAAVKRGMVLFER